MKFKNINRLFMSVLLLAVLLRLVIIFTKYHCLNSDNGILGLMAKHILKGEFPVFFYGQPYMGSLEAFVIAGFFFFLGATTNAMVLAMCLISTLGVISAYFLGKELKDKTLGIFAMLLFAVPSPYVFWHGLSAFGGYPETLLFGNILIMLAIKIMKTQDTGEKTKYYLWLGLVGGLAFWTHLLVVYYLAPIAVFLLVNEKKRFLFLKAPLLAGPAFILGSLPLWIYNIYHGFGTFKLPVPKFSFEAFIYFFHTAPLLLLGGELSWFYLVALSVYIISFIFIIVHKEKTRLLLSPKFIFFLLFVSIVYFFSKSHMALQSAPRHIIPLFTVGFMSVAYLSWYSNKKFRRAGLIPLLIILFFNGIGVYKSYLADKEESYADHKLFTQAIDFLNNNGLNTNYCPFAISQKLNFLSGENIINADPGGDKYPSYENIVEETDKIAFINLDTGIEPTFNMLCQDYSRQRIGDINIYYNFSPKTYYGELIPTDKWKAASNYNNKELRLAFDRNIDRYWCTTAKKKKGMYFKLDLGGAYKIHKIALCNADHWRNYASDISLETSMDGKQWTAAGIPGSPAPIFLSGPRLYYHFMDGRIELLFTPVECRYIKITQNENNPLDPWEINELFVWEYSGEREINASEASEIYEFLSKTGVNSAPADFWMSAKIRNLSKGGIKTITPFNVRYPNKKDTCRFLKLDKNMCFIIDNENRADFEKITEPFKPNIQKKEFKNYTCYWFTERPDTSNLFFWSGYGLLKANRLQSITKKDIPASREEITFKNGIKLLGYNIQPEKDKLLINYFWRTKKFHRKIFVFVHFIKDGKIIFQNDHPFLEQFSLTEAPAENEIFRESYTIDNAPQGTYDIVMGLCIPDGDNKRIEIISPKPKRSKISIGTITV